MTSSLPSNVISCGNTVSPSILTNECADEDDEPTTELADDNSCGKNLSNITCEKSTVAAGVGIVAESSRRAIGNGIVHIVVKESHEVLVMGVTADTRTAQRSHATSPRGPHTARIVGFCVSIIVGDTVDGGEVRENAVEDIMDDALDADDAESMVERYAF